MIPPDLAALLTAHAEADADMTRLLQRSMLETPALTDARNRRRIAADALVAYTRASLTPQALAAWQAEARRLIDAFGASSGVLVGVEYAEDPQAECAAHEERGRAARRDLYRFLGLPETEGV